jgi:hypothetical protein
VPAEEKKGPAPSTLTSTSVSGEPGEKGITHPPENTALKPNEVSMKGDTKAKLKPKPLPKKD